MILSNLKIVLLIITVIAGFINTFSELRKGKKISISGIVFIVLMVTYVIFAIIVDLSEELNEKVKMEKLESSISKLDSTIKLTQAFFDEFNKKNREEVAYQNRMIEQNELLKYLSDDLLKRTRSLGNEIRSRQLELKFLADDLGTTIEKQWINQKKQEGELRNTGRLLLNSFNEQSIKLQQLRAIQVELEKTLIWESLNDEEKAFIIQEYIKTVAKTHEAYNYINAKISGVIIQVTNK